MAGIILFTAMIAGGVSLWIKRRKLEKESIEKESIEKESLQQDMSEDMWFLSKNLLLKHTIFFLVDNKLKSLG